MSPSNNQNENRSGSKITATFITKEKKVNELTAIHFDVKCIFLFLCT